MGLFSRRRTNEPPGDDAQPVTRPAAGSVDREVELPADFDGRPVSIPLSDVERSRIARALESLRERGIDVDDLEAIGSAYDAAFAKSHAGEGESADAVVEVFAIAIGEYLVRHSARQWAIVTDAFGTDLGLVAARAETVIVPHNLVSARWMRGESGWIPGVVAHLVRLRPRPS